MATLIGTPAQSCSSMHMQVQVESFRESCDLMWLWNMAWVVWSISDTADLQGFSYTYGMDWSKKYPVSFFTNKKLLIFRQSSLWRLHWRVGKIKNKKTSRPGAVFIFSYSVLVNQADHFPLTSLNTMAFLPAEFLHSGYFCCCCCSLHHSVWTLKL